LGERDFCFALEESAYQPTIRRLVDVHVDNYALVARDGIEPPTQGFRTSARGRTLTHWDAFPSPDFNGGYPTARCGHWFFSPDRPLMVGCGPFTSKLG
jgi:hypothetical protein